ncbi:hypothetical protein EET67_19965 [Pseudaminobacter arsenicus]|uniref:Uncharacterized protein n=1 Tax=Borborobacter arsenicus TaxID=1851146 RepID=A0A432V1E0_9HYPH|nr:hypothetical protein [Pseudaminobacter arsenicus]RUM96034.1 hypothetical protein EET67_19965 [Pseudaminobacter arsenicus]
MDDVAMKEQQKPRDRLQPGELRIEADTPPDFRVRYSQRIGWMVEIVSRGAYEWTQKRTDPFLFENTGRYIRTDLAGVNLLVHNARAEGLKMEYIGPERLVIF